MGIVLLMDIIGIDILILLGFYIFRMDIILNDHMFKIISIYMTKF